MSVHRYPPKTVWNKWKKSPPELTVEQAIGYMLQNMVALQEQVDQHGVRFFQLARETLPADEESLKSYLQDMEDRYQAGLKAMESEFRTALEAQTEVIESQNEIILALEAKVEAFEQAPPEPEEMVVWDVINLVEGAFRSFFEGFHQITRAIQVITKNKPPSSDEEKEEQDNIFKQ